MYSFPLLQKYMKTNMVALSSVRFCSVFIPRSRHQERLAARNHFRAMRDSQRAGGSKPTPLFRLAMDNLRDAELVEECIRDCDTPEYLTCPLLGELMIDPVTIATGKVILLVCAQSFSCT